MFLSELARAAELYGVELTEEQMEQFGIYYRLLIEWNEKMNLTAITEPKEVAVKHMIDSLSAWDGTRMAERASLVDVGTGAGFPGLPLKIFRPKLHLTLLDSLHKRVTFLQTVVQEIGLSDVACIHARAEEAARNKAYREQFDIAVSRAVARLPILAEYCLPFVKKGGLFVALKGMRYQEEAEEAKRAVKLLGGAGAECVPVKLPELEDKRAVIYIKKTAATSKAYPRKAGTPEKKPIL